MRYYAIYDSSNNIIAIGTGDDGVEITEEEYNQIFNEIYLKNDYVHQVYLQQITLTEVPEIYRDEIEQRVDALIKAKEKELAESKNSVENRVDSLEEENKTLNAKVTALTESNQFLEDCIVELAEIVYA